MKLLFFNSMSHFKAIATLALTCFSMLSLMSYIPAVIYLRGLFVAFDGVRSAVIGLAANGFANADDYSYYEGSDDSSYVDPFPCEETFDNLVSFYIFREFPFKLVCMGIIRTSRTYRVLIVCKRQLL